MEIVDHIGGGFSIEAAENVFARHECQEIVNTEQGSQFASSEFTGLLLKNGIVIGMEGKTV